MQNHTGVVKYRFLLFRDSHRAGIKERFCIDEEQAMEYAKTLSTDYTIKVCRGLHVVAWVHRIEELRGPAPVACDAL
jgi:hypothetical protein